jgi:hypothetical protein
VKTGALYAALAALGYVLWRSIWAAGYLAGHRAATLTELRASMQRAKADLAFSREEGRAS